MQHLVTDNGGQRLDTFVHDALSITRSFAGRLCSEEKVRVNGKIQKPSYKVKINDTVDIDFSPEDLRVQEEIEIPILYEDDDVIVINKPVGVLSHSKGAYNPEATVATFIAPKLVNLDGERGGIVHRLDRATSGVMICAKNEAALTWLQKQFSARKVHKTYLAVVTGTMELDEAIIDMPIARNPRHPKTFHVDASGRSAVTHYKVTESNGKHTLLQLEPQTGRTHQLRVHLAHQKHPIVGDTFYDGEPYDRLLLHAHKLKLTLPNKTHHEFVAEIPSDFHTILHD